MTSVWIALYSVQHFTHIILLLFVGEQETEDQSMETEYKNEREEVKAKGAHLGKF